MRYYAIITVICSILVAGCMFADIAIDPTEPVAGAPQQLAAESPTVGSNLGPYRWLPNGLMPAMLAPELLAMLISGDISAQSIGNRDDDSRDVQRQELMRYVAMCQDRAGIARNWRRSRAGQEQMTACLLSLANQTGHSILISARVRTNAAIPWELDAEPDEIAEYSVYEGSFFGNLFADEPTAYACRGLDGNAARSRSSDRSYRVCTDPDPAGCTPVLAIGPCNVHCATNNGDYGWQNCSVPDDPQVYSYTVSAYLRRDIP